MTFFVFLVLFVGGVTVCALGLFWLIISAINVWVPAPRGRSVYDKIPFCARCDRPPHADRLYLDCLRYTAERPSEPLSPPDSLDDYQPRSLEREWADQVLARGLAEQAEQERAAVRQARIAACRHNDVESIEITTWGRSQREHLRHCRDCGASEREMKEAAGIWMEAE